MTKIGHKKPFRDDPGRLARWYSSSVGDENMSTPEGRQAAARGLAETYGVSEKDAGQYLYYYFPNTLGKSGRTPRTPHAGTGKRGRERSGDDPGTMSHQCSNCRRFFAGPDYGITTKKLVTIGPSSGAPVSHGFCGEKCQREYMFKEVDLNAVDRDARERARRQALQRSRGNANQ